MPLGQFSTYPVYCQWVTGNSQPFYLLPLSQSHFQPFQYILTGSHLISNPSNLLPLGQRQFPNLPLYCHWSQVIPNPFIYCHWVKGHFQPFQYIAIGPQIIFTLFISQIIYFPFSILPLGQLLFFNCKCSSNSTFKKERHTKEYLVLFS